MEMFCREDGTLWVVSSRGGNDQTQGTLATFDVFDREGRFARQVSVKVPGSYRDDAIAFAGDRLYLLRGFRSAQAAMFGGDDSTEEIDEAEPMSIVCYDIAPIVQGKN